MCHAGPACRVGSRRTKENPDSIPSVGVTELASIVVTTMADDEVEFIQTDVFVNYCVYLCVQYRARYVQKALENVGEAANNMQKSAGWLVTS